MTKDEQALRRELTALRVETACIMDALDTLLARGDEDGAKERVERARTTIARRLQERPDKMPPFFDKETLRQIFDGLEDLRGDGYGRWS